ncbi:unnamed protein product [Dicrocoelium dendriticum]|nr:unnamed protein product [Dicrocoelium dendriticum]
MEPESKPLEQEQELVQDPPVSADRKDEDEEEEEEEEEDRIVEKSPNSRFHKRNKRFPKQIVGVDSAFVAIEPKSGKEVIWNECILSDKKGEKENRYLSIIKKLKRNSHPFLARFLDAWIAKPDDGPRKLAFITERLDECSLKQFLCNSPKNNRSWKRHVGQLLSVLMFLHRLGIAHGNLTKETIYYQNSGNLRVGPFSLGGCLDQKSQSSDVYALGVVALEIAVWTPTEFPQSLSPSELCQEMLIRLENADQRSFIDTCFESNAPAGNRIKRLINHNAVTEVPVLKLLSAKVLVDAMRSVTSEDGATTEQTGFATLLKEYLSRYEDETVIVEVHFAHDKIVNSRSWKDFRSNFTLTSKFLDDVKNGFYPLFGCRWHWAPYQDEDDESCAAAGAGTTNGTGATAPSSGHFNRTDSGVIPSQAHSSGASTVPSASVSRKQSSATRTSEGTGGAPVLHEDEFEASDVHPLPPSVARSSSLCDSSQSRSSFLAHGHQSDSGVTTQPPFSKTIRSLAQDDEPSAQATASFFIGSGSAGSGIPIHPDEGERLTRSHSSSPHGRSAASSATDHPDTRVPASELTTGLVTEHPLGATLYGRTSNTTENADPLIHAQTSTIAQMGASASPSSPPTQTQYSLAADQPVAGPDRRLTGELKESGSLPALNQITQTTGLIDEIAGQELVGRSIALVGFPTEDNRVSAERLGALARYSKSADDAVDDEAEDEDKDEEDDDDDNDDEDEEDDDDDDKNVGESVERFEPQTIHVAAPDRAPAYPALFTHCQYFYIGAGRWQVYVQMWFVEDRLKREAFVQVFDDEWHDCQRVADLFEASRCVNPADRSNLVRLLSLARHNCPLIDGELQLPGPLKSRSSHFDAFELHEKLTALRLHQQAREQFVHETAVPNDSLLAENAPHSSAPTKSLDTEQLSSVPTEKVSAISFLLTAPTLENCIVDMFSPQTTDLVYVLRLLRFHDLSVGQLIHPPSYLTLVHPQTSHI